MSTRRGLFITLEGPDGSGKTTNLPIVKEIFESKGFNVFVFRDPGGCEISEEIREVLLKERSGRESVAHETELLLFAASRIQLARTKILPELEDPKSVVICDRFIDSTYAYQGYGLGYLKEVEAIDKLFWSEFKPDYTLFFSVSFETSIERIAQRNKEYNRLNAMETEFRKRTFRGYRQRFLQDVKRMRMIETEKSLEEVREQIVYAIETIGRERGFN